MNIWWRWEHTLFIESPMVLLIKRYFPILRWKLLLPTSTFHLSSGLADCKEKVLSLCEAFKPYKISLTPSLPSFKLNSSVVGLLKLLIILSSLSWKVIFQDLEPNKLPLSAHREGSNTLKEFLFLNTGSSTKNWLSSFSSL